MGRPSREIRRVPPGWKHPTVSDPDFPSPYWRDPEEILHSEAATESYVKADISKHFETAGEANVGKVGDIDLDELAKRRARYNECRDAVGLEDGESFLPCIDYSLEEAQAEWDDYWRQWQEGTYPGQAQDEDAPRDLESFEEWHGLRPTERHFFSTFRPPFEEAASCWQMYEVITEGTPISPVFCDINDLFRWMITDGGLDGKWNEEDALEVMREALQS